MMYLLIAMCLAVLSLFEFIEFDKLNVHSYYEQLDKLFYLYFAALLFILTAFRYKTGWDYGAYLLLFDTCLMDSKTVFERGFVYLNRWFKITVDNFYIMQVCISLVACYGIFKHIVKYAQYPNFMLFLYFITIFIFLNLAQVRQFLAVGVICYGVQFIHERKLFKWSLVILLAMQFHNSALLAFPIYFTSNIRISKPTAIVLLFISVFLNFAGAKILQMGLFVMSLFLHSSLSYLIERYIEVVSIPIGMGYLLKIPMYIYMISLYSQKDDDVFMLNFLLTLIISAMARHFDAIGRISFYYTICGNGFWAYTLLGKKASLYKHFNMMPIFIIIFFLLFNFWGYYRSLVYPDRFGESFINDVSPYKSFIFHTDWSILGAFSLLLVLSIGFMIIIFTNLSSKKIKTSAVFARSDK